MQAHPIKLALLSLALAGSVNALAHTRPDGPWRGNGDAAFSLTSGNTSTSTSSRQGLGAFSVCAFRAAGHAPQV